MSDHVIERARTARDKADGRLRFAKRKLAESEAASVRRDGTPRTHFVEEAARRAAEISIMERHLAVCEGHLARAIEDLPRREAERERAAEVERLALAADTRAAAARAKVEAAEREAAEHRARAREHLASANQVASPPLKEAA